ncbi:MAG: GntR family transcriptional regulator [Desulfofustis sp.]|nr:GntR family transcriptional regulator [Desulfofustis sp.]
MAGVKVVRASLKDQIKKILIERIVGGKLLPGDRIKELQVAKELGTSQAPVREAIRCLETLGYIDHIPHVGAMVKSFNRRELEEAYQVREAVEVFAVAGIDEALSSVLTVLDQCLDDMQAAVEQREIQLFTKADNRFHRTIVEFSGNTTMVSVWDSLKIQVQVVGTLVEAAMPLQIIYELHPPIVEALRQRRSRDAAALLTDHYRTIKSFWGKSD